MSCNACGVMIHEQGAARRRRAGHGPTLNQTQGTGGLKR